MNKAKGDGVDIPSLKPISRRLRRRAAGSADIDVEGGILPELSERAPGNLLITFQIKANPQSPSLNIDSQDILPSKIPREMNLRNSKLGAYRMKNVEMTVEDNTLIIKVDLSKNFGPSKSGKTIIVASTEGNLHARKKGKGKGKGRFERVSVSD